ncbi:MAG: class I SAM-dependent methyltransferase, partial [Planctomycetota bacterium]
GRRPSRRGPIRGATRPGLRGTGGSARMAGVTPDYDPLARWFAPLERLCFGGAMQRARTRFHPRLAASRTILCLGPGDGRALPPLLGAAPAARILAVEPSQAMGQRLIERLTPTQRERVEWIARPWLEIEPELGPVDAIVSDFFLDQFEGPELERMVERSARHLAAGGSWAVADFQLPEGGLARQHARLWLGLLYPAFGRLTGLSCRRLDPPAPSLRAAGLERVATYRTRLGLLGADLWQRP